MRRVGFFAFLVIALFTLPVFAQIDRGNNTGGVTDSTGAVTVGAQVTWTQNETNSCGGVRVAISTGKPNRRSVVLGGLLSIAGPAGFLPKLKITEVCTAEVPVHGQIPLPDRPGLGVERNDDTARKAQVPNTPWFESIAPMGSRMAQGKASSASAAVPSDEHYETRCS
jgi:hypothetical protein